MNAGRKHETLKSELKDRLLHRTIAVARVSAFVLVLLSPSSQTLIQVQEIKIQNVTQEET